MQLTNGKIIKLTLNKQYINDMRRKADYYLVSYLGSDNNEYRKGFYVKVGTSFNYPITGDNNTITALTKKIIGG